MKIVAVVPVKTKSERVKSKNFRDFYDGKSLFDLLLKKLLSSQKIDKIYISSNETNIKKNVEKLGCRFLPRDEKYCNNDAPWSDVIYNVVQSIPEVDDTIIVWCHTTSPLFEDYDNAINKYCNELNEKRYDGLVTVKKISEFLVSERKQPINYSWGPWHRYSQHLDKVYAITGAIFIAQKREMMLNRYVISKNPFYYEVSELEAVDIDNAFDFELAKILYNNKSELIKYAKK